MAIIMPKQENPSSESGYIKLFLNSEGHLSSIDEDGVIRTYAEGTNVAAVVPTQTEPFYLSFHDLYVKHIDLEHIPIPGTIRFSIAGCLDQVENQGFYLDGNSIRWDNYGLDGFLDQNDLIQVFYSYYN